MGFHVIVVRGENHEPGHNKFYEMTQITNTEEGQSALIKRYGKIGASGQYITEFGDAATVNSERVAVSERKVREGYDRFHRVSDSTFPSADAAMEYLVRNHSKLFKRGSPAEIDEVLYPKSADGYADASEVGEHESKPEPIRSKDWSSW